VEFDEFGVVGSIFFADLRGRSQGRFTWLHARIAYQDQFQSQIPWCSATIEAFAE